jgi:hypothetical protein
MIFPDLVLGMSGTIQTFLGQANLAYLGVDRRADLARLAVRGRATRGYARWGGLPLVSKVSSGLMR